MSLQGIKDSGAYQCATTFFSLWLLAVRLHLVSVLGVRLSIHWTIIIIIIIIIKRENIFPLKSWTPTTTPPPLHFLQLQLLFQAANSQIEHRLCAFRRLALEPLSVTRSERETDGKGERGRERKGEREREREEENSVLVYSSWNYQGFLAYVQLTSCSMVTGSERTPPPIPPPPPHQIRGNSDFR